MLTKEDQNNVNTNCNTLKSKLAALLLQYNNLQVEYKNLNKKYNNLSRNYTNLYNEYINLQDKYRNLLNDYYNLQDNYNNLQDKYYILQSKYNDLQNDYSNLQGKYQNLLEIINLEKSKTLVKNENINQPAGYITQWTFDLSYPGYIEVNVQSSTTTKTYVKVWYSSYGVNFEQSVDVGNSGVAYFPVLPGTVNIAVGNYNLLSGASETVLQKQYLLCTIIRLI